MKKIIFILILKLLLQQFGYAQNLAVTKLAVIAKKDINFLTPPLPQTFISSLVKPIILTEPAVKSFLFFNEHPLIGLNKAVNNPVILCTEISFRDVFENAMNSFKSDLINTYDDHITELFKDAPSLLKVKCIISL